MPEMTNAREHHREARGVGRRDHFVVAHRAAGLNDCGRARFSRRKQAVGERKVRVRRDDRTFREASGRPAAFAASAALIAAMRAELMRLIWPAPMPTVALSLA